MTNNSSIHFTLLNAGLAEHSGDWNWENVSSPFARLYMVNDGHARIHMSKDVVEIKPGHIYLVPPFTLHRYENDSYLSLYYFHVYESLASGTRILEEYSLPSGVEIGEIETLLVRRLLEINPRMELYRYDPSFYDNNLTLIKHIKRNQEIAYHVSLETNGILSLLISRFVNSAAKRYEIADSRITKTISYIRENIDEEIGLDELASQCCLSKDHFIKLFKKEVGTTPQKYVILRKIEKVQLLLISTDLPIKNIARQLSFNNLSNFNKLFRQISGTTPENYRKSFN